MPVTKSKPSEADRLAMLERYANGEEIADILEAFEVSKDTLSAFASVGNYRHKRQQARKAVRNAYTLKKEMDADTVELILAMRRDGSPMHVISEEVGYSPPRVREVIEQHDPRLLQTVAYPQIQRKKTARAVPAEITPEIIEIILTMKRYGMKTLEIANEIGFSLARIQKAINENDPALLKIPYPQIKRERAPASYKTLPSDIVEQIVSLRLQGWSFVMIGENLGIKQSDARNAFYHHRPDMKGRHICRITRKP